MKWSQTCLKIRTDWQMKCETEKDGEAGTERN